MNERDLQKAVIEMAQLLGWKVAHFRPAKTEHGWRTPVQADGAGFPDLVLVRDRVVYVELKSGRGRLSEAQHSWIQALLEADQEAYVWCWEDWMSGDIETLLRRTRSLAA